MTKGRDNAWRTRPGAAGGAIDRAFGRHTSAMADAAPLQRSSIVKKLNPDQHGARRLAERFGDRLVCVRYRTDAASGRRFTTVELLVEERQPAAPEPATALVRLNWNETELRRAIKAHGGVWLQERKLWRLPREAVSKLKIQSRVLPENA